MPRIITLTPNPALDFAFDAEKIEPNHKLRCSTPRTDPGGGGINVARAALRLGAETIAVFTAGGAFGASLKSAMKREGVPSRIVDVACETRPAFHARESSTCDEYRFNFPGEPIAEAEADALLLAAEKEMMAGDFLVGSGSLPPGLPAQFWAKAARIARAKGVRFVLDSIHGAEAVLAEGLFLLRMNKRDAADLAGRDLAWPDETTGYAKKMVERTKAINVVITHGGDGAVLASTKGVSFAKGFDVPLVSAVGAGDSFVAALCVALIRGENDETALRYAMAAASASLKTPGTALFDPDDVARLFESR